MPTAAVEQPRRPEQPDLFTVLQKGDNQFIVWAPAPASFDDAAPMVVGVTYDTAEAATQGAAAARERFKVYQEYNHLRPSFNAIHGIRPDGDQGFVVYGPAGVMSDQGWYIGRNETHHASWEEAKVAYVDMAKSFERLSTKPIARFDVSGTQFSLATLTNLDQRITPTTETLPISPLVSETLLPQEALEASHPSAKTYHRTLEQTNWKVDLFNYVRKLLDGPANHLKTELNITSLRQLTPQQAIELSLRIVIDLTAYEHAHGDPANPDTVDHMPKGLTTVADDLTAQQLLEQSVQNKQASQQQVGLGVCRNFASTVKAVFEAVKDQQADMNRLRNVYCLYETDPDNGRFDPQRQSEQFARIALSRDVEPGHAWNSFVTITEKGAEAISVDATWGERDLDSKAVVNVDHTLLRMEPAVHALLSKLDVTQDDQAKEYGKGLMHYTALTDMLKGKTSGARRRWLEYTNTRALPLLAKAVEAGIPASKALVTAVFETMNQLPDITMRELEQLAVLAKKGGDAATMAGAVDHYLSHYDPSETNGRYFTQNPDLQRRLLSRMRYTDATKLQRVLSKDMRVRTHTRAIAAGHFEHDFTPWQSVEDKAELRHLLESSRVGTTVLQRYQRFFGFSSALTEAMVDKIVEDVRIQLRTMEPAQFDATMDRLSDWKVLYKASEFERSVRKSV